MTAHYLHQDATVDELIEAATHHVAPASRENFLGKADSIRSSFSAVRSLAADFGVVFVPRGLRSDFAPKAAPEVCGAVSPTNRMACCLRAGHAGDHRGILSTSIGSDPTNE